MPSYLNVYSKHVNITDAFTILGNINFCTIKARNMKPHAVSITFYRYLVKRVTFYFLVTKISLKRQCGMTVLTILRNKEL